MNKNKGFTLIELLVVIAIIGILASVVLASLSSARMKAKVAVVQSTMASMRAQAELGMNNGKYIANLCTVSTPGGLSALISSINSVAAKTYSGGVSTMRCAKNSADADVSNGWGVQIAINGVTYCTDSTGYVGPIDTAAGEGIAAASAVGADVACK